MGSDCIHSDPHEGVYQSREQVIHAAGVRAMVHAARFFDQQRPRAQSLGTPSSPIAAPSVSAQTHRVEWISSDESDSEGGGND